jgi:hypothetical protein
VAGLQERNGSFRILFRYQGKQRTFTLGVVSRDEAEAKVGAVDLLLLRIKQGLVTVPPGVTIEDFLLHDGRVKTPGQAAAPEPTTFKRFRERYLETHRNGAMEAGSLDTVESHLNHFSRTLGDGFPMRELQVPDLQRHVNERARKKYRSRPLSCVTL